LDTHRKISPLGNRLLVRPIFQKRWGVVVIPDTVEDMDGPRSWLVLDIGPKVKDVAIGDRVLAHSYTTGPIDLENGLKLLTEDQVLAVL